jgi:hypothetical protein
MNENGKSELPEGERNEFALKQKTPADIQNGTAREFWAKKPPTQHHKPTCNRFVV